jgi:hypothetical protein
MKRLANVMVPIATCFICLSVVTQAPPEAFTSTGHSLSLLAYALCVFFLIAAPGVALTSLARGYISESILPGLIPIGAALAGWLLFWIWFASPATGYFAVFAVPIASSLTIVVRPVPWASIRAPLIASSFFVLAYMAIAGNYGHLLEGNATIAARYWVGLDNDLMRMVVDRLLEGSDKLKGMLVGDWRVSDRATLQAGSGMFVYVIAPSALKQYAFLCAGMVLNAFWVCGLWAFLRSVRVNETSVGLLTVIAATSGAMFFDTVYIWPKLIAAALVLFCASALIAEPKITRANALCIALAAILSIICHGSAVFGLAGLCALSLQRLREVKVGHVALALLVCAVTYAPWSIFVKYNPPGDRLTKWHIAGIASPDESIGALPAIKREYAKAGLKSVAINKLNNVRTVLGDWTRYRGEIVGANGQWDWSTSFDGIVREFTTARVVPAAGLMIFGVLFLLLPRVRQSFAIRKSLSVIVWSLIAYCLLEWGGDWFTGAWLHTAPQSAVVLWIIFGALAVAEFDLYLLPMMAAIQAVFFFAFWCSGIDLQSATPHGKSGSVDMEMQIMVYAAFCILGAYLWSSYTRELAITEDHARQT